MPNAKLRATVFSNLKSVFNRFCPEPWHPRAVTMSKITSAAKGQVISGPFRGLKYITYPKLFSWSMVLGTFELELHSLLERLCSNVYNLIVNVGAGEGYYAVGMALRCPTAQVVAFDSDAECRALILQMARKNSVSDRVLVKGTCDITGTTGRTSMPKGEIRVYTREAAEIID